MTGQRRLQFSVDSFEESRSGLLLVGRNCGSPLRPGDVFTTVRFLAQATRVIDRQLVLEAGAARSIRLVVLSIRAFQRDIDELPGNCGGQVDLRGAIPPDLINGDFLFGEA